jgi:hypothetical protein
MAKKKQKPNATYDLPASIPQCDLVVLGMDPGSRNHGISLVGLQGDKVLVLANSVMTEPLNTLVEFNKAKGAYLAEIARWVKLGKPNAFAAERFQTRGNSGPLIEFVSCMLGLVAGTYPKVPFKLTIASSWKNKVQKRFDVDLKEVYTETLVQPHQLDAALIGIYGLEQGLKRDLDYSLEDIITQAEATSLIDLRNRRK